MAKGKKTGGRDFQAGNPGGPGQPKIPEEVKAARKLNRIELERIINKYLYMPGTELRKLLEEATKGQNEMPMIEAMIAKIMLAGFSEGDQRRLEFILDRLVGKVKDQVEVNGTEGIKVIIEDYTTKKSDV